MAHWNMGICLARVVVACVTDVHYPVFVLRIDIDVLQLDV